MQHHWRATVRVRSKTKQHFVDNMGKMLPVGFEHFSKADQEEVDHFYACRT